MRSPLRYSWVLPSLRTPGFGIYELSATFSFLFISPFVPRYNFDVGDVSSASPFLPFRSRLAVIFIAAATVSNRGKKMIKREEKKGERFVVSPRWRCWKVRALESGGLFRFRAKFQTAFHGIFLTLCHRDKAIIQIRGKVNRYFVLLNGEDR